MTSKIVTITSKNQITLPADFVRKLNLTKNRRLAVRQRGEELILKPEPSLEEIMTPIWKEMKKHLKGKKPLTDEELNRAVRDTYAAMDAQEHHW